MLTLCRESIMVLPGRNTAAVTGSAKEKAGLLSRWFLSIRPQADLVQQIVGREAR